ncbi:contractile injection system protein, VgrG/Pvc8 family [Endozoicomonas montiporae]|uniref:Gp28 protein n=1 Tax=Endozoicomonas montiporae CL-33 TaxID=570277 RepID=A0A142BA37_9GAMM|nr:contractile injection system protein, VgrG/Pvc8 family [Endozoicomonas montiporae]AMO55613.1 Gp28 protein [Endozoicomonas montiporae CL-33]
MQPVFTLEADRQDITNAIKDRLISLSVTDESGIQSDTLEIKLDDRDRSVRLPRTGAELFLHLGYRNDKLSPMGLFIVDELNMEGPPDTLTIRARAADFRQSLKSQNTRSWENVTLDDLTRTIAGNHQLEPVIAETLKDKTIAHIDQTEESDLHFLTRLARQYDAVSTIKEGRLLFVPKGQGRTASGKDLPAISLTPEQLTRYRFTMTDRGKYTAVIAHWHNSATAQRVPVRVGEPDTKPVYTLRGQHPDEEAAKVAARSKLDSLQRGTQTASLTLPGNPSLRVEGKLTLTGFRNGVDGEWVINQVTHKLGRSGFVTSIRAESVG